MSNPVYVRGAALKWAARFKDVDGAAMLPGTVTLNIVYPLAGVRTPVAIPMVEAAGVFTAQWESRVASPGECHWDIRGVTGSNEARKDGQFTLVANEANAPPGP